MKEYNLGVIGAGNMSQAIIQGSIDKNAVYCDQIYIYDIDKNKMNLMKNNLSVKPVDSIIELCDMSDIIIIAVKPNVLPIVLKELKSIVGDKAIVSIAAGWSADMIKEIIGIDKKVLRLMPNTPLMVGEGMSVFEEPSNLADDEKEFVERLFLSIGKIEHAPLKLMDAVTGVSGSGPAYVYMFIEALADAGVLCGLPRDLAQTLAAQTVKGAAQTVIDSGLHPGALKDAVCSPGGTTIEAVRSLEQDGFRGTVIKAVESCVNKSKRLAE